MKIVCNGGDLSLATNIVSKAVGVNKNIPILEGIKLSAIGNTLTLSAYNNEELYIEKTINANIIEEGELIVNGQLLTSYTKLLNTNDDINIENLYDNKIVLKSNKSSFEINYYDIDNFPTIGNVAYDKSIKIKEKDLKKAFDKVIYCAKINDVKPILRCVHFKVVNKVLSTLCIDSSRFSSYRVNLEETTEDFSALISATIASDIVKILDDSDNLAVVSLYNNSIYIEVENLKIRTTIVEGSLFNDAQVMPTVVNTKIIANKDEFMECLRRVSIISNENANNNQIKVEIDDNIMKISARSERGIIDEKLDCKIEGEPIIIALNNKFLMETMARIDKDFFVINFENSTKPIIIKNVDDDSFVSLILPLRLF